ncbi:MAG: polysaccharide deacetylase family protein [Verrucomicrobia bacterium]|nr:polysaccharide deacetylase family protein [Verrucomicrobiota bacterium]MBU1736337.1 polysaccharide deacetylase family protein [Verrucomicrobiota bacterium]MBU1857360.1 polysaccharide deacetylase family protein [Verrucomicrobiota bacterium]
MKWKNNKKWVYSITYDEGCELLLKHALPVHRRYGIPGHVALVASQVGVPRNVPGSSLDGMMILSREELTMLAREGWGVSCHGMTHAGINADNARYEVVEARRVLEQTLQRPVPLFCVPNNNNSYPAALAVAAEAGYTAIMTITDMVNLPTGMKRVHPFAANPADPLADKRVSELLNLGRVPLHTEYPPPFYSKFDPYKRIHQAIDAGGWIIDYCHCPTPGKAIHPWKDCTLEQLEERFATVCRIGGNDVWLAEPNEVVEYLRHQSRKT